MTDYQGPERRSKSTWPPEVERILDTTEACRRQQDTLSKLPEAVSRLERRVDDGVVALERVAAVSDRVIPSKPTSWAVLLSVLLVVLSLPTVEMFLLLIVLQAITSGRAVEALLAVMGK